jgi:uncharacterized damage-inducible protein DinB
MEVSMEIVNELNQFQVDVLKAIDGLTEDELTRENAIGKWSVRDTLLHMAMWDGEALKALSIWRIGYDPDWSQAKRIQQINDFWHETLDLLTTNQVIHIFNSTCAALANDMSMISDDIWKSRGGVPKWLDWVVIKHGNHHLEKLLEYRKSICK